MADYVDALLEQTAQNSAFNAAQAEINRDWQEYMSGSSHQREVKDLIAAGLNPVLSANSGSTWQSVSNATADVSSAQGLANLAATVLNNAASIEMSKISAGGAVAAAGASAAGAIRAAELNSAANVEAANIAAGQSGKNTATNATLNFVSDLIGAGADVASTVMRGGHSAQTWHQLHNS